MERNSFRNNLRSILCVTVLFALWAGIVSTVDPQSATAAAPAAQAGPAVTSLAGLTDETVLASATTTIGPFRVDNCVSYIATIDQSGTGTFALNVLWLMPDQTTVILTEANVATSKGDGLSFEDAVRSTFVSFELEETGASNEIVIDAAQLICVTR